MAGRGVRIITHMHHLLFLCGGESVWWENQEILSVGNRHDNIDRPPLFPLLLLVWLLRVWWSCTNSYGRSRKRTKKCGVAEYTMCWLVGGGVGDWGETSGHLGKPVYPFGL